MEKTKKQVADIAPLVGANAGKKPVNAYDLNGRYIKTFDSISDAAKGSGLSWVQVSRTVKLKQKRAGSYQFRFAEE